MHSKNALPPFISIAIIPLIIFFGIFSGLLFAPLPHRAGHLTFAFLNNKTAIEKIEFNQMELLQEFLKGNLPTGFQHAEKVFIKGSIDESFKGRWRDLVLLGGLIFSLIAIFILIIILELVNFPDNNLTAALLFLFVASFFFGVIIDAFFGWWLDGIKLMQINNVSEKTGFRIISIVSSAIIVVGAFLYRRYLKKSLKISGWQLSAQSVFKRLNRSVESQRKKSD
jgi:hypothetical protein